MSYYNTYNSFAVTGNQSTEQALFQKIKLGTNKLKVEKILLKSKKYPLTEVCVCDLQKSSGDGLETTNLRRYLQLKNLYTLSGATPG